MTKWNRIPIKNVIPALIQGCARHSLASCLILFLLCASVASAADDLRAFLQEHCYSCHGPEKQQAELRLDMLPFDLSVAEIGRAHV